MNESGLWNGQLKIWSRKVKLSRNKKFLSNKNPICNFYRSRSLWSLEGMSCHLGGIANKALKFGTPVQTLTLFESLLEHDQYISQMQQHFVESIINILTSESTPASILLSYKSITPKAFI